uniref:Uncharacterized protein n=1 Tax=viral metagenome TaxID=1070528 RepID=A0A6M3LG18_9ZZZZ
MQKRLFCILAVLITFALFCSASFAAVGVRQDGTMQGTATDLNLTGVETSNDGSTFTLNVGKYGLYELAVTGDTLVAADSGKTIILESSGIGFSTAIFNLPAAVTSDTLTTVSLNYTIVAADQTRIRLEPSGSDRIVYAGLVGGDALQSPATTGDTVTVMSFRTGQWAVTNIGGTWIDGN